MPDLTPTRALIDWLNGDAQLIATDAAVAGVWEDPGPPDEDERVFVTVNLITAPITQCSGGRAFLECLYAVQAVGTVQQLGAVRRACARIVALLDEGGLQQTTLQGDGFGVMSSQAVEPIEYPDPEVTTGIRWEHRGAQFRILVEPT